MQSDSENPAGRTETEHVPATCNQRHAIPIRLPASTRVWQRDSVVVLGICLLALIARVHRLMSFTAVIENEGPHYVRLAMNLLHGKGYLGMAGVPDLSFAPSYPLLIAATTAFAPNPELAARIVSVAFGCLMVVSMYFLALQVFRRETALVCATLTALHPVLVAYSTSVYNETTYLAILAASMAAALRLLKSGSVKWAAVTGMLFGVAYLTRPEAIAFPLLTILSMLLLTFFRHRDHFKNALVGAAVLATVFGVLAAPYVAFLSSQTGTLSFQTKGKLNYTIGRRFNQGMPYAQASMGIRDDLTVEGPFLDPIRFSKWTPYPWTVPALASYIKTTAKRNIGELESGLMGPNFGIILVVLVSLGLFREPWNEWSGTTNFFLFANFILITVVILQVHLMQFRYLMPFYVFLLLWASNGVVEIFEWTGSSATLARLNHGIAAGRVLQVAIVGLLLLSSIRGVLWNPELQQGGVQSTSAKLAGTWLGQHYPQGMEVMTAGDSTVAYYAGGTLTFLPYADSGVALRYIASKNPSFVVVNSLEARKRPYLSDWLLHGIPDPHARLVYESGGPGNAQIAVYRWK